MAYSTSQKETFSGLVSAIHHKPYALYDKEHLYRPRRDTQY